MGRETIFIGDLPTSPVMPSVMAAKPVPTPRIFVVVVPDAATTASRRSFPSASSSAVLKLFRGGVVQSVALFGGQALQLGPRYLNDHPHKAPRPPAGFSGTTS
ncbi:MAG: hypothetical protein ACYCXN_05200 [Acidimicrobiales bacterium]